MNTIYNDVTNDISISKPIFSKYITGYENLFLIDDIPAWSPNIRSRSKIRSIPKRNFNDPSLAVAALGISPDYFLTDFKTLGFLFESLCIRDLKIYAQKNDGFISYYHDQSDVEVDAVLHLKDGRYALIEIKLGEYEVEKAAKNLNKVESLIKRYNEKNPKHPLKLPTLKIIITATTYGYRRKDNVLTIPIGCLKD